MGTLTPSVYSLTLIASSLKEGAFWYGANSSQKLSRLRGKWHEVPKGERLGDAEFCEMFPLSFAYAQQLPHEWWRLLGWHYAPRYTS